MLKYISLDRDEYGYTLVFQFNDWGTMIRIDNNCNLVEVMRLVRTLHNAMETHNDKVRYESKTTYK